MIIIYLKSRVTTFPVLNAQPTVPQSKHSFLWTTYLAFRGSSGIVLKSDFGICDKQTTIANTLLNTRPRLHDGERDKKALYLLKNENVLNILPSKAIIKEILKVVSVLRIWVWVRV